MKERPLNAIEKVGQYTNSWGAPMVSKAKKFKYKKELEQIKEMGFTEVKKIELALDQAEGDVQTAIDKLTQA
jgi:hypothetical protein